MNHTCRAAAVGLLAAATTIGAAQGQAPESPDIRTGVYRGHRVTYQVINGLAVAEGDIILGTPEELKAPEGSQPIKDLDAVKETVGRSDPDFLWPDSVIPYAIDGGLPEPQRVMDAIQHWNDNTEIQLVERTNEPNWVQFESSGSGGLCLSFVGMAGGEQSLLLQDDCGVPAVIHEIGHAAGLFHEQVREDRNDYVSVLPQNMDKRFTFNFARTFGASDDLGHYDYGSIMHYGAFLFTRNGRPTLETMPPGILIGEAEGLSAGDIDGVNRLYGEPPTMTTISTNPPGLEIEVDGETFTSPQSFDWEPGSNHTVNIPSPQGDDSERFLFARWGDSGGQSRTVIPFAANTVFTAHSIQQLKVESGALPPEGGAVTFNPPSSDGFYTTRIQVEAVAAPAEGFSFGGWKGPSLAGIHGVSGNPARFPVRFAGLNYTGVFTQLPLTTVTASDPGRRIVVDGRTIPVPINFPWDLGSTHTISVDDAVQLGPSGASRWLFQNWSDGGAITHNITVPEDASTFTAEFTEQQLLTTAELPAAAGDIDAVPGSGDGFYDTGTPVVLTATPGPGFELSTWFGDLTGTENPQVLLMSDQQWVGALFLESRELLSGVPVDFSLPAVGSPTIFFGFLGYRVNVPPGATRLKVSMITQPGGVDVDLHMRLGEDPILSRGRVVSHHSSTGPGGRESITITPESNPPLESGTYFIALVVWTPDIAVEGTLTAELDAPPVPVPEISISTPGFTFTAEQGMNPPPQTFDLRNSGDGTLNYQIVTDQPWLSTSPDQGSSTGETDTIEVSVNSESLEEGTFHGTITISEPPAQALKQEAPVLQTTSAIIPVTVVVTPAAPEMQGPAISSGGIILATGTPVVGQVSPLSIFTIFGQEFAPEGTLVLQPELDAGGDVATNLGGTCVEIDGQRSPLFAVLPTQINGQASDLLQPGQASVEVIRDCGTSDEQRSPATTVTIGSATPAFFNFVNNLDGNNHIATLHGGGPALVGEPGLIPGVTFTPAQPNEFVSFFGTGFGPTDPALESGQIPSQALPDSQGVANLTNEVTFTIGGIAVPPADVFYAGTAPCCAGLQQFVVRVPPNAPDGDLGVTATVDGVSTPMGPFIAVKQ